MLPDFISENEINNLKQECADLVDKMDSRKHHSVFSAISNVVTNTGSAAFSIIFNFTSILCYFCDLIYKC